MCDEDDEAEELEYEEPEPEEPEEVPRRRDENEVDSMAEAMDEAASAAEAGLYDGQPGVPEGQRLVDEDYIEHLEQRERDREWDARQREERMRERARAQLKGGKAGGKAGGKGRKRAGPAVAGAPPRRKKRGWVKWVVISVVLVVGGIVGLGIWGMMMAGEALQMQKGEAIATLNAAKAAAEAEVLAPAAPEMATKEQCEQMMRHGTLLKARLRRRFRRLPRARQQARINRVMKTPKMVAAVEQCTSQATRKLAECIIAAKNNAAFKACRDVE